MTLMWYGASLLLLLLLLPIDRLLFVFLKLERKSEVTIDVLLSFCSIVDVSLGLSFAKATTADTGREGR